MSIEKVIEYIVLLSGWLFAIGIKSVISKVMDKASTRFVSKEMYEKDLLQLRDAIRIIDNKIDKLMEL